MNFLFGSSQSSSQEKEPAHNCVLPHALQLPALAKLKGKRVVLASASPRRRDILHTCGLAPEIVPSTFEETLGVGEFEDPHEYPVATATHKAIEVYERLVRENPEDAPDLVIGADTVVLTHPPPGPVSGAFADAPREPQEVLEKPVDRADNLRMLLDLNGGVCEAVTGVTVVYPVLEAPGYKFKSIEERTLVHFADSPRGVVEAYVEKGEGLDRAGGFAVQGLGALLIRKVDGDWNNVVGFPAASFFQFLELLIEEEEDFLAL